MGSPVSKGSVSGSAPVGHWPGLGAYTLEVPFTCPSEGTGTVDARIDAGRELLTEWRGDESGVRCPTASGGAGNFFLSSLLIDSCTLGEIFRVGARRPEDPFSPVGQADPAAVGAWLTLARCTFSASFYWLAPAALGQSCVVFL